MAPLGPSLVPDRGSSAVEVEILRRLLLEPEAVVVGRVLEDVLFVLATLAGGGTLHVVLDRLAAGGRCTVPGGLVSLRRVWRRRRGGLRLVERIFLVEIERHVLRSLVLDHAAGLGLVVPRVRLVPWLFLVGERVVVPGMA